MHTENALKKKTEGWRELENILKTKIIQIVIVELPKNQFDQLIVPLFCFSVDFSLENCDGQICTLSLFQASFIFSEYFLSILVEFMKEFILNFNVSVL